MAPARSLPALRIARSVRKWLPLAWKYLLVVATSCSLAFLISQASAHAADSSPVPTAKSEADYTTAGSRAVAVADATWHDDKRKRDVPVRIYTPAPADQKAASADRDPVILFSHGLGGNRDGGKLWATHWASHGFVVVVLQHPGSDDSLWKGRAPLEVAKSLKDGMTLSNLGLRVGDVHFAIDEIVRRAAAGEEAFRRADAKRIGMSGHSFGAQTTLAVSGQKWPGLAGQSGLDLRINSSIAFSPNARNKVDLARQFGDITLPFFSVTGTRDGSILGDGTRYEDRMKPFKHMPAGGKYLAVFDEGDHMVFGGHELGARRKETARDREIQRAVKAGTLVFWNATLLGDDVAKRWLESGGFRTLLESRDTFASK
jgi:dienelactone hydrolase